MLDTFAEQPYPGMLAPLPHRIVDAFEIRIFEYAERNRNQLRKVAAAIINGRAAVRAEMICGSLAAVGSADPLPGLALQGDAFRFPPRLGGKGAA